MCTLCNQDVTEQVKEKTKLIATTISKLVAFLIKTTPESLSDETFKNWVAADLRLLGLRQEPPLVFTTTQQHTTPHSQMDDQF